MFPLAASAILIRVDSPIQGRTFVDTDRAEIRKSLQEVGAPPAADGIPDWLPPYPGATLVNRPGANDPPGFAQASYPTPAAPDDVFAHYEAAVRAARVTVKAVPVSTRLDAVSYDDETDILRLRNPATGKEYVLDGAAMLNYSHSTPLQSTARDDFPAWVVAYPGARVRVAAGPPAGWQPQKVTDMKSFVVEMDTPATVAEVAAFYREAMSRNGLGVERETETHPRASSLEARTPNRMHQVYLEVKRQGNSTMVRLPDHYTTPRR